MRIEPDTTTLCSTADEVREHAKRFLYKALGTQRTVAVVGAGVSAGYGYPSWQALCETVVSATLQTTHGPDGELISDSTKKQLEELIGFARKNQVSDAYTTVLQYCAFVLGAAFKTVVSETFPKGTPKSDSKILDIVRHDLSIRRFVTLNYDRNIEDFILRQGYREISSSELPVQLFRSVQGEVARSITLAEGGFAELIEMASGNRKYRHDVLHVHGRIDLPESLVVGEQDYKAKYLKRSVIQRGYTDGLDYLFASNPILFLGVGLSEEDVMRPLREYLSDRDVERNRPIFALMPATNDSAKDDYDVLARYMKYGIYTLQYAVEGDPTASLERALKQVRKNQAEWRAAWEDTAITRKAYRTQNIPLGHVPTFELAQKEYKICSRHSVELSSLDKIHAIIANHMTAIPPHKLNLPQSANEYIEPYQLHKLSKKLETIEFVNRNEFSWAPIVDPIMFVGQLDWVRDMAALVSQKTPYRVILTGERGYGRGAIIQSMQVFFPLLQRMREDAGLQPFDSSLFVNTSFSQEFSSVVEHIVIWLENAKENRSGVPKRSNEKTENGDRRISRLRNALVQPRGTKLFLVIANAERLFRVKDPLNRLIHEMFEVLFSDDHDLDILLLSRTGHGVKYLNGRAEEKVLTPPTFGQSTVLSEKKHVAVLARYRTELEALARFIGNHSYAMQLVCSLLADDACTAEALSRICSIAGSLDSGPALDYTVGEVIRLRTHSEEIAEGDLKGSVLKHLALISQPISTSVIAICIESSGDTVDTTRIRSVVDELVRQGLVVPVFSGERPTRIALHRLVRRAILAEMTSIRRVEGEFTFFSTSLYGVEPEDTPTLDIPTYEDVLRLLRSLTRKGTASEPRIRAECLRAAQSILESLFSVGVLSRIQELTTFQDARNPGQRLFDAYVSTLRDIYDAARDSEKMDRYIPFYGHELTWLLNERGVALLAQGNLFDAVPCFRKAIRESKMHGQYVHYWIETNYAFACIQRAHIRRASNLVEGVLKKAKAGSYMDANPYWIAKGWGALILHISGKYDAALAQYKLVIKALEKLDRPTGIAVFAKHKADLHRTLGQYDKAERELQRATAAAERSGSNDSLQHIRVSQARLLLSKGGENLDFEHVYALLDEAHVFAVKTGLDPIAVDALIAKTQVAIARKQIDDALQMSLEASAIATRTGMRLRKFGSHLQLAEVRSLTGDHDSARKIVEMVRDQTMHFGYQMVLNRAERLLVSLPKANAGESG